MDKKTGLVFVNRDGLINGLAITLKNLERGNVTHVSGGSVEDDSLVLKTDDIYIDEEKVFHLETLRNRKYLGCAPASNMITIADAFDIVEPLYDRYPYLEIIMKRAAMDMFLSDGNDISAKMIDAAIWYEAYMPYTEEILSLVKTRND